MTRFREYTGSRRLQPAINEVNAKKRKLKLATTGVVDTEQKRNLKVAATKIAA